MDKLENGGILSAAGFRVAASRAGIKSAEAEPDVALIVCDGPAVAAGVFTQNRFAAAPVLWDKELLPADDMRAVVVNSGNANACTGEPGKADVRTCAATVAQMLGCRPEQVCVSSTGIIGHPLPMDKLVPGIRTACDGLSDQPEAAAMAARAIMTTDTRPKTCAVRAEVDGVPVHVGGMAKGSGMIAPNMATMLAYVTTDAAVPAALLQQALRDATDDTFNRITVDGDSSTNDSVIALASGASGAEVSDATGGVAAFREALHAVMADLSLQIVRDGEGATMCVAVHVHGARTPEDAHRVARTVAESQLFKCAVYGRDPNWGRIVCAVGYSGVDIAPEKVSVHIGQTCVLNCGAPTHADAAAEMQGEDVTVRIDLGAGAAESRVWTCDLTDGYVRINAEYHT